MLWVFNLIVQLEQVKENQNVMQEMSIKKVHGRNYFHRNFQNISLCSHDSIIKDQCPILSIEMFQIIILASFYLSKTPPIFCFKIFWIFVFTSWTIDEPQTHRILLSYYRNWKNPGQTTDDCWVVFTTRIVQYGQWSL